MVNKAQALGFVVGLITVLVIAFIVNKLLKRKGFSCELDERQLIARGNAYKSGFFTMLIVSALFAFLYIFFDNTLPFNLSFSTVLIIILLIGVVVFAVQSIYTDSYLSFKTRPASQLTLFIILFVAQLFMYFINKEEKAFSYPNLFVAIAFGIIIINMIIKMVYDKHHIEEENEE